MKKFKGLGFGIGAVLMICWLPQAWNSGHWLGLSIFAWLYFCLIIWEIFYTIGTKKKNAERREEEKFY